MSCHPPEPEREEEGEGGRGEQEEREHTVHNETFTQRFKDIVMVAVVPTMLIISKLTQG